MREGALDLGVRFIESFENGGDAVGGERASGRQLGRGLLCGGLSGDRIAGWHK
jgi:hypothetical protein